MFASVSLPVNSKFAIAIGLESVSLRVSFIKVRYQMCVSTFLARMYYNSLVVLHSISELVLLDLDAAQLLNQDIELILWLVCPCNY